MKIKTLIFIIFEVFNHQLSRTSETSILVKLKILMQKLIT